MVDDEGPVPGSLPFADEELVWNEVLHQETENPETGQLEGGSLPSIAAATELSKDIVRRVLDQFWKEGRIEGVYGGAEGLVGIREVRVGRPRLWGAKGHWGPH